MTKLLNELINILAENLLGANEFENIDKEQSDIKKFILSMLFLPNTITCFRALFKAYELAKVNERDAKIFLDNIVNRLSKVYEKIESGYYLKQYNEDKEAWNIYYDVLANEKISDYKDIAWEIVKNCKVN